MTARVSSLRLYQKLLREEYGTDANRRLSGLDGTERVTTSTERAAAMLLGGGRGRHAFDGTGAHAARV